MEAPPTTIDLKRLAAEVSVRHGIRVDQDDPMMAVVTLNRLVFEQSIAQVLECVQASVRDFDTAADKVQVRAGTALAQEVRDCGLTISRKSGRRSKTSGGLSRTVRPTLKGIDRSAESRNGSSWAWRSRCPFFVLASGWALGYVESNRFWR
jgi:hypothetical protein